MVPKKRASKNSVPKVQKNTTNTFVLVVWSKLEKGVTPFSVQPEATVLNKLQLQNPRIEAMIEERINMSSKNFKCHLGRVLAHGTKASCNLNAQTRVEQFNALLKEGESENGDEDEGVKDKDSIEENGEETDLSLNEEERDTEMKEMKQKLKKIEDEFQAYKVKMAATLAAKDKEIDTLIKKNLFLQNTLPTKFEDMAKAMSKNKVAEPVTHWDDEEVQSTLDKLNFSAKEVRELKHKKKSTLLARACLTYGFPKEILAKSVVVGGNQQHSKNDPKLDQQKIDDICEFVMARFPESDRKTILGTLGYKVRDLKRKASLEQNQEDINDGDIDDGNGDNGDEDDRDDDNDDLSH